MSDLSKLHSAAMEAASRAEFARLGGDEAAAQTHFAEAFRLEREAALMVAPNLNLEPTRSVLLRSAASLAIDCNDNREAERLIATALSGDPPEEIADELRDLYETATFRRHLQVQGRALRPGEIQLSLSGSAVGYGVIDAEEYFKRAAAIESLLLRTTERQQNVPFREKGPPKKLIAEDFRMYVSVPKAASFSVTLKVGRHERQLKLLGDDSDIVAEFLDCVALFADDRVDELRSHISNTAYFRNFVSLAKILAPDGERIRTVGFTATEGQQHRQVALRGRPTDKWNRRRSTRQRRVELVGTLYSAHKDTKRADRNFVGIRDDRGFTRTIIVAKGQMNDIVRPHWDTRVVATCFVFRDKYRLIDLQPASDSDGSEGEPASG